MSISLIVYSYKGKNLYDVVKRAIETSDTEIKVFIRDQVPIIRKTQLESLGEVIYKHQFWDFIESPCNLKHELIGMVSSKYICMISDDTMLSPGWDKKLIDFVENKNVIVSGQGKLSLDYDKYFLKPNREESTSFDLSNYIDRNLVFGVSGIIKHTDYPKTVKYFGEEELWSMKYFERRIPIYSAPSGTYEDLKVRTLENLYTPFSIDHNYNSVIDAMSEDGKDWAKWHGIIVDRLKKIPHQRDDVLYNPYDLAFNKIEQERFIDNVNGIY
jgi:hypothetical protein